MSIRSFTQDLTGSNESLEDLLSRLRLQLSRPMALKGRDLSVTRLARGVPVGSELEYVDLGTIAHAFNDRR